MLKCDSCGAQAASSDSHFCTACGAQIQLHGLTQDLFVESILAEMGSKIARHFFAKVVGTSHPNSDGSSRQEALRHLWQGEPVLFRHDVNNAFSKHAMAVHRRSGEQLGYLDDRLGRETLNRMEAGEAWMGLVTEITGGHPDAPTRGANLLMVQLKTK